MKNHFLSLLFIYSLVLGSTVRTFASLERGQEIYSQICVTCHGPNLDGGIGPSLVDAYWKYWGHFLRQSCGPSPRG